MGYILKENTQEEIDSIAMMILGEQISQSTEEIVKHLEKFGESVVQDLLNVYDGLFTACLKLQQNRKKNKIRFIHIFYLKSALLTGKYELMLSLFDKTSYLDQNECYSIWIPSFFIKYFKDDLDAFHKKASIQLPRFGYKDYQDIRIRYYDMYLALIGQFILREIDKVVMLPSFYKIEKEEEITIIYGGYMDKGIQVYPPMEVMF